MICNALITNCNCAICEREGYNLPEFGILKLVCPKGHAFKTFTSKLVNSTGGRMLKIEIVYCAV